MSGWEQDFDAAVGKLPALDKALNASLGKAAKAGATVLLAGATRRAPHRSGKLVGSGRVRRVTGRKGQATYSAGFRAFYAHFVEHGTRNTAAQPFLRPAADQDRDQIVKAMANEVRQAVGTVLK